MNKILLTIMTVGVATMATIAMAGSRKHNKHPDTIVYAWTDNDGVPLIEIYADGGVHVRPGSDVSYDLLVTPPNEAHMCEACAIKVAKGSHCHKQGNDCVCWEKQTHTDMEWTKLEECGNDCYMVDGWCQCDHDATIDGGMFIWPQDIFYRGPSIYTQPLAQCGQFTCW